MNNSSSWLDSPEPSKYIKDLILQGENNQEIANRVYTKFDIRVSRHAVSRFRKRHIPEQYLSIDSSKHIIETSNYEELNDPEQMIRDRGLDPEIWKVDSCSVTEWEGPTVDGKDTFHHAKLNLKQIKDQIRPARSDGWKAPEKGHRNKSDKLVVALPDPHAPYHDKHLHSLFLAFMEDQLPDEGIILGDLLDFPDISKHPSDPENDVTINECIQSGYEYLRDIVSISTDTKWKMLLGNHDERLKKYVLNYASKLHGLAQADGKSVFSLEHLLRLDELDIELIDPHGPYANAQVEITPKLTARHGWLASKEAGATAMKTLESLGHSVIVGHTHRMAVVYKTTYDVRGNPVISVAAEAGTMCSLSKKHKKSLAYTVAPNWQPGFLTVQVDESGEFVIEMARYINNKLYWRNQVYE